MLIFAALAILSSIFKIRATRRGSRYAQYMPSGIAFAVGFLNTPSFSIARLVGGVIELLWRRRMARTGKEGGIGLVIVASGFVLGEGVVSIVGLVLRTFGVGVVSCWGCLEGVCGSC